MNKLEKSIQKNAFNQDEMLYRIQAESYGMKSNTLFGGTPMKKVIGLLALSFTLIFAVWFGLNQNDIARNEEVVMLVGVDINPSFELSVNRNNNVVKIEALNEDAKTIDVSDLIDEPVEDVVEELIRRSAEAGFIVLDDLDEDFVVVSTVSIEDDEDDQDEFEEDMEKKIRDSEFLQSLNIVQIKATQREKFEAELNKAPAWIEYSGSFFPVIVLVFVMRSFLFEPFKIPSESMLPTLFSGDYILVNKYRSKKRKRAENRELRIAVK